MLKVAVRPKFSSSAWSIGGWHWKIARKASILNAQTTSLNVAAN